MLWFDYGLFQNKHITTTVYVVHFIISCFVYCFFMSKMHITITICMQTTMQYITHDVLHSECVVYNTIGHAKDQII